MSATPINRKAVRLALATGLQGANIAQAVYGYQEERLNGQARVTRVFDASVTRPLGGVLAQGWDSQFTIIVQNMVLRASQTGQHPAGLASEDALADMEYATALWISQHQTDSTMPWRMLSYERPSIIGQYKVGGNEIYLIEDIYVLAEVYG